LKTGALAQALKEIQKKNRRRLEEVAESYGGLPEMPAAERVRYFKENLTHHFGRRERQGIERFHAEAVELGLAPAGRPIRWLE